MAALPTSVLRICVLRCVTSCVQITTAPRPLDVLSLNCNGTYSDFPFQNFGWTGEVRSTGLALRNRTFQVPLNIRYRYYHLFMAFFVQSNTHQCWVLLTSNLTANYVSTTQKFSLLCTSTPSLTRATPPTPSL
jgi:hypothetical protein